MKRSQTKPDSTTKEDVLTLEAPQTVSPTQPVIKSVTATRVEKFTEVAAPESGPALATLPAVEKIGSEGPSLFTQEPEDLVDTADVVRSLVDQIENENADYVLSIFRLPNFLQDGKTGTNKTVRKYLDRFPVTLDYLPEIKARFGGGTYQIFLLTPRRAIKARWVEHIDGPAIEEKPIAALVPVNPSFVPMTGIEPESQLAQLLKFGQMWKDLRALVLDTGPAPQPAVAAVAPLVMSNPAAESESDPELDLIVSLLNSGNQRAGVLAEGLISRRFGPSREPGMGDLLERLVEPFVPAIQTGLVEYFKVQARAGKTVTPRGNASPGETVNAEADAADGIVAGTDPNAPPGDGEEQMDDEPYLDLVENLIMVMGVAVHQPQTFDPMVVEAARLVQVFADEEPDYADWIESLLMMAPKGVLTSLVMLIPDAAPLRSNPEALRFIEQLQVKLKEAASIMAETAQGENDAAESN